VLSGIDLAVRPGERLGLLGSNGSGKTTLLRVLAGLAAPLEGEVRWLGVALPKGAARCRVLGYVLQAEPPVHFTVRQLVALGLGTDGPPSAPQRERASRALADEGLTELADRRCSTLSGGEWQRAVIARALVAEPPRSRASRRFARTARAVSRSGDRLGDARSRARRTVR
jgi:putative spermidine/putrescine transport system ATP-binding protein